jgi:putative hemolysin
VLVVVVITYVSIVVGELVPKRMGQIDPEPIARVVARPMNVLSMASQAVRAAARLLDALLLRLIGVQRDAPGRA